VDRPSTTTSLMKSSIDSIYSVPNIKLSTSCEESKEITEITNTFSHSIKTNLACGQSSEMYGEDEAAKDCL